MANYNRRVLFRVLGRVDGFNVISDIGTGRDRRVCIIPWDDERRVALHPRMLFALGLLPSSKVGMVARQAVIQVTRSTRKSKICQVKGTDLGAYLTMCRAFGWDAVAQLGKDSYVNSWSDNESRMHWTSGELLEYGPHPISIVELRWRGEPLHKQVIHPAFTGSYTFEMQLSELGMFYQYDNPLVQGQFPARTVTLNANLDVVPREGHYEVILEPPRFESSMQDFGEVPIIHGYVAPGRVGLVPPPTVEDWTAEVDEAPPETSI